MTTREKFEARLAEIRVRVEDNSYGEFGPPTKETCDMAILMFERISKYLRYDGMHIDSSADIYIIFRGENGSYYRFLFGADEEYAIALEFTEIIGFKTPEEVESHLLEVKNLKEIS